MPSRSGGPNRSGRADGFHSGGQAGVKTTKAAKHTAKHVRHHASRSKKSSASHQARHAKPAKTHQAGTAKSGKAS